MRDADSGCDSAQREALNARLADCLHSSRDGCGSEVPVSLGALLAHRLQVSSVLLTPRVTNGYPRSNVVRPFSRGLSFSNGFASMSDQGQQYARAYLSPKTVVETGDRMRAWSHPRLPFC